MIEFWLKHFVWLKRRWLAGQQFFLNKKKIKQTGIKLHRLFERLSCKRKTLLQPLEHYRTMATRDSRGRDLNWAAPERNVASYNKKKNSRQPIKEIAFHQWKFPWTHTRNFRRVFWTNFCITMEVQCARLTKVFKRVSTRLITSPLTYLFSYRENHSQGRENHSKRRENHS